MSEEQKKELKGILDRLHQMYHQRRPCLHNGKTVYECTCNLKLNNQLVGQGLKILEGMDVSIGSNRGNGRSGQKDPGSSPGGSNSG